MRARAKAISDGQKRSQPRGNAKYIGMENGVAD
jgi:hypothetical protein